MPIRTYTPILGLLAILIFSACHPNQASWEGTYRAVLIPDTSRPNLELPFDMLFSFDERGSLQAEIHNAEEKILIKEIEQKGDSVFFYLPVFESYFKTRRWEGNFTGSYVHKAAGGSWTVPLEIQKGELDRFPGLKEVPDFDPSGRWKVLVNPEDENPEVQIAELYAHGSHLTGTFLTQVGDYRFLEGSVSGNQLFLSCFDGAHSLLFSASLSDSGTLEEGLFCGGPRWQSTWRAVRDEDIQLPDSESLTYLKPGYQKIDFSFPDLHGNAVSLSDSIFANKTIILQIIGSWCPNCMDETRFFAELYEKYRSQGLEIIALCFESADTLASRAAIQRFKNGLGASYTFLHAGVSNKRLASESLPMLNRIISYPTSIFIDKEGQVRRIFTGFSGPGTGQHYLELTGQMTALIEELL